VAWQLSFVVYRALLGAHAAGRIHSGAATMTESNKNRVWTWIERGSVFVGMLLGVIAFFWQLQERRDDRKEKLISLYTRVERVSDSMFVVSVDLLNVGKHTSHIRRVVVREVPSSEKFQLPYGFWIDSAGQANEVLEGQLLSIFEDSLGVIPLEPNTSTRLQTRAIDRGELEIIADGGYIDVSTFRQAHTLYPNPSPLHQAIFFEEMLQIRKRLQARRAPEPVPRTCARC
jgi:hypothetical protein